ncbi:MAG: CDP-alcohol phosphatidyltransferase family protein [archaeon]|nr:CDP-alcohol phosphatidyltransferase family protein [Candidatus Micrarchaeota archaeon]
MVLYKNRQRFEKLSIKIGSFFSKFGLTPNQWTIATLIPTFIAFYFLLQQDFLLAALFFIISSFFDLIDGSVARVMGLVTKKGAYLDTIIDRYVEFIIVLGLLFASLPDFFLPVSAWILIYLFGATMTTYSKAAAKEKELTRNEIKGGLLERAERLILLFIGILLASFNPLYLTYIIVVLAILSNISAIERILTAFRLKPL